MDRIRIPSLKCREYFFSREDGHPQRIKLLLERLKMRPVKWAIKQRSPDCLGGSFLCPVESDKRSALAINYFLLEARTTLIFNQKLMENKCDALTLT